MDLMPEPPEVGMSVRVSEAKKRRTSFGETWSASSKEEVSAPLNKRPKRSRGEVMYDPRVDTLINQMSCLSNFIMQLAPQTYTQTSNHLTDPDTDTFLTPPPRRLLEVDVGEFTTEVKSNKNVVEAKHDRVVQLNKIHKFSTPAWQGVRYKTSLNSVLATPGFVELKINAELMHLSKGKDYLASTERVLAGISNAVLHQKELLKEGLQNLVNWASANEKELNPNCLYEKVTNFFGPDSPMNKNYDLIMQILCGKRTEAIEVRRNRLLNEVNNINLKTSLSNIPPSTEYLFGKEDLTPLIQSLGGPQVWLNIPSYVKEKERYSHNKWTTYTSTQKPDDFHSGKYDENSRRALTKSVNTDHSYHNKNDTSFQRNVTHKNWPETIYNDDFVDDDDDDDGTEVTALGDSRYSTSLHVSKHYIGAIIGKKGYTKSKIEHDTKTGIKIPKQGQQGDITIFGHSVSNVKAAKRRINMIVMSSRMKQRPTHFISIPMNSPDIMSRFTHFQERVLQECSGRGLDESIFIIPSKLHITSGVMCLMDNEERMLASKLLTEAKEKIIMPILDGHMPLKIRMRGLSYMNDDPKDINVLYANVEECGSSSGVLQQLVDSIVDFFCNEGLMKNEDRDNVKMHVTLLNSKYRSREPSSQDVRASKSHARESFDGSEILERFADYDFGVMELKEIHLSQRNALGPDGYYQSTCVVWCGW